jgi:hypothetical protein
VREVTDQERILVPGWPTVDLPSGDMNAGGSHQPTAFLAFCPKII